MTSKKVLLVIVCLAFLASGCGRKQEPALTFAVGGAPGEIEFWEVLIDEFEEQTGIEVNILRQPTDTDQRRQGLVIPLKARKDDPEFF